MNYYLLPTCHHELTMKMIIEYEEKLVKWHVTVT
jgi:hypothetical protein